MANLKSQISDFKYQGRGATLVWFRQDLRLRDNPALAAAVARGGPIVPVYIFDSVAAGAGAASRVWLDRSLRALDEALREQGARLILRRGDAATVMAELVAETRAEAVYWNRCYEPAAVRRDTRLKSAWAQAGLEARSFNSALLHEPHAVVNRQGRPYQVFGPFWRHCQGLPVEPPVPRPRGVWPVPVQWPRSLAVEELPLRPRIAWDDEFWKIWEPGEAGALRRLKDFLREGASAYATGRDFPAADATSRLSPHLHFGEIGPRQLRGALERQSRESGVFPPDRGAQKWLQEIGWREFAHHLIYHFPQTETAPLRSEFARFPWAADPEGARVRAWQKGKTGYPLVDAGMRELWRTGWMHNRVRMVAASFLVKHLRRPWTEGEAWFRDTLVDADVANNTLGWQWSAGCGADAAPYFRIFSPVLQGGKFDPKGEYVRKWVPELALLPDKHLHAPWTTPPDVLRAAGIELGVHYPEPIVDHATARAEALAAYQAM